MSTTLADFQESDFTYTPTRLRGAPQRVQRRILDEWQMDLSWVGSQPVEAPDDAAFWRYQFDQLYFYPVATYRQNDRESKIAPIEFRVSVNWLGRPPEALIRHLQSVDAQRLATLFNTGVYEGWMDGFNFVKKTTNVEHREVSAADVNNLGIPQFEVNVYDDDGRLDSSSTGFFDPFHLFERPPEFEVWRTTRNDARSSYEIRPQAGARQRLLGQRKEVYLNGHYIGNTVPTRGTIWLKMAYRTRDGTYKDRHTGRQMWSRRKLVDDAGMHPQEVRAGGQVYKVGENADQIFLISGRERLPERASLTRGEEVDPRQVRGMDFGDSTTFNVRRDTGGKLGKFAPPETHDITEQTTWQAEPL